MVIIIFPQVIISNTTVSSKCHVKLGRTGTIIELYEFWNVRKRLSVSMFTVSNYYYITIISQIETSAYLSLSAN